MLRPSSLDVEVRGNFGISCCVRLHFMLKLEAALSSETSTTQSIVTRSKTAKQNQHEPCIAMRSTVGMLLVSFQGCGLAHSHGITFCF